MLSIPYPDFPHSPFWGLPTAHINFCEEDYILTPFVAELANTLTNITYIIYSVHGLHNLRLARRLTWTSALPLIGLMAVGFCSATYHMTLREIPQLADDLSMIFPTVFILLRILTFEAQDPKIAGRTTAAVAAALVTVYTVHLNINKPILHIATFGVMVHFIRKKTWRLLAERVPDPRIRRNLQRTALFGGISFGLGFFLWVIDRFACSFLTQTKRAIGMPWAFVLELHGWWHVLTAIGAYVFIVLTDHLTSEKIGEDLEDAFGWPAKQILQRYAERRQTLANGGASKAKKTH
jgi:dihydroceramidase